LKLRLALGGLVVLCLSACKPDPMQSAAYAAACHGAPLHTVEERQQALEDGYAINRNFNCIDKNSWEEMQRQNALNAEARAKRAAAEKAQALSQAQRSTQSLADARRGFRTSLSAPASGTPLPKPPAALFIRADYTGAEGRRLPAFVSPDPRDGQRHAAMVWITGGDSSTLEDFWTEGSPGNDQSASAIRKAGVIMMFPTLRGGNVDEGRKEFFYGEVDDIHAAANLLANLPYVDPARIYLGGHSAGGTLALLAAETGGRFAAIFSLGPVSAVDRYPQDLFPSASSSDPRETRLRSPIEWLNAISTPTYLIEGMQPPSNAAEVDELCVKVRIRNVNCIFVQDSIHFSVIDRVGRVLGPRLAGPSMGEVEILQNQDFRGELPAN